MTLTLRAGIAGLLLLGSLQACKSAEKAPAPRAGRSVVAVYAEVDGVSFSSEGASYARFTDFLERDEVVRLTDAQLSTLLLSLEREGFFKELNRTLAGPARSVPPASFRICVASPGRSRECVFLCEPGANVPARYREIFATLPLSKRPAALKKFLKMNQDCDR